MATTIRRRINWESSSSTDVFPADVALPPAFPPSLLPAKPSPNRAKDPNCEVCRRTKVTRASCGRNPDDRAEREIAESFGNMMTAGHKVLNGDQESRMHHKVAVIMQDLATQWIQSCHAKTKPVQETMRRLPDFLHPPRRSGTHGIAERAHLQYWFSLDFKNAGGHKH